MTLVANYIFSGGGPDRFTMIKNRHLTDSSFRLDEGDKNRTVKVNSGDKFTLP